NGREGHARREARHARRRRARSARSARVGLSEAKSPGGGYPGTARVAKIGERPMQLFLSDPSYTDRLAAFLRSVGRRAVRAAPGPGENRQPGGRWSDFR